MTWNRTAEEAVAADECARKQRPPPASIAEGATTGKRSRGDVAARLHAKVGIYPPNG